MSALIRTIIVIQSLENERPTGRELYDDCIKRRIDLQGLNFTHKYHEVKSKQALIGVLKYYGANSKYLSDGVLIHLEMHGDEELNGLFLCNKELIEWRELVELFRDININTNNNLYITMATCYGRYMFKGIDPDKKSPYVAFISTSSTVLPSKIIDNYFLLFENLLASGDLIQSYKEMEKNGTDFYYKDSKTTFKEAFDSILSKLLNNPMLRERIISEAKAQTLALTGTLMTDEEGDSIFERALRDTYWRQYSAFDF